MSRTHPLGSLIIGMGMPFRKDESVGLTIAGRLEDLALDDVTTVEGSGGAESESIVAAWRQASLVVLVDSTSAGAPPGTIHRFDAIDEPVPKGLFRYTSHVHELTGAIEEARATGNLPPRLIVFGIEGRERGPGSGLSDEVESAACRVQEMIVREIEKS